MGRVTRAQARRPARKQKQQGKEKCQGQPRRRAAGKYLSTKQFFIRKEDYGTAPKVGKLMEYDGICYTIRSCQTEHGLYLVELERVRQ